MSAVPGVRGWFSVTVAKGAFRRFEASAETAPECGRDAPAASLRQALRQAGHTVAQLSAVTRRRYGSRSPYFIPPTFLYKLNSGVTPHVCQIVALSEITGYRFVDWMRMCGFDLHQIPRLQVRLHTDRTVLVTPVEFDRAACCAAGATDYGLRTPAPESTQSPGSPRYLFAKIGSSDARMCPKLVAGSVMRVDRGYSWSTIGADLSSVPDALWLVEYPGGLSCSRVRWIDHQHIVLSPSRPPWGNWPLRLSEEARILGLVDQQAWPGMPALPAARTHQLRLEPRCPPSIGRERLKLSDLLRLSRRRSGLTFREAHRLTRAIAQVLGDGNYAIALGLLSDYEAIGRLPRHIAKIISLCVAYSIDLSEFMTAGGVNVDDSQKQSLLARDQPFLVHDDLVDPAGLARAAGMGAGYA
ncbi:MAG TPA: hypothetical protein VN868_10710 [Terriglobales bacterium]|nr:hypothetical protein [Terriglobales bacterium]